jgi:hypothetical protein
MDKCSILFCCNGNDADKKVYGIWVRSAARFYQEGDQSSILFCHNANDADKKVYGIWVRLVEKFQKEDSCLTHKHWTWLGVFARDKCSILFFHCANISEIFWWHLHKVSGEIVKRRHLLNSQTLEHMPRTNALSYFAVILLMQKKSLVTFEWGQWQNFTWKTPSQTFDLAWCGCQGQMLYLILL